jgi:hypothetical protein
MSTSVKKEALTSGMVINGAAGTGPGPVPRDRRPSGRGLGTGQAFGRLVIRAERGSRKRSGEGRAGTRLVLRFRLLGSEPGLDLTCFGCAELGVHGECLLPVVAGLLVLAGAVVTFG